MQTDVIAKRNHQREYIIGTLCQSSGGPIAFASVTYLFIFSFFAQNLPISRATNEWKTSMKEDRKNVRLQLTSRDRRFLITFARIFPRMM